MQRLCAESAATYRGTMKYAVVVGLTFIAGTSAGVGLAAGTAPTGVAAAQAGSATVPTAPSAGKGAPRPGSKLSPIKPKATETAAAAVPAPEPAPAPPSAPVVTAVTPPEVPSAVPTPTPVAPPAPTAFKEPVVRIGFGIVGEGGIVATEKPSTGDPDKRYPGYFGPKYGGGIALEGRFFGALGLEIGLLQLTEKASADINGTKTTIEQSVIHIPMYLKGILPFGPIRPFIGFGPEFVFGVTQNYTLLGGILGAEGYIPIKRVVLTIPFGFRYAYNIGMGSGLNDRVDGSILGIGIPRTNFQHNAAFSLGVKLFY
jgi:hypothetical protein